MNCLHCGSKTTVLSTRKVKRCNVKRRRRCLTCQRRFTTYESPAPFDQENKILIKGVLEILEKLKQYKDKVKSCQQIQT